MADCLIIVCPAVALPRTRQRIVGRRRVAAIPPRNGPVGVVACIVGFIAKRSQRGVAVEKSDLWHISDTSVVVVDRALVVAEDIFVAYASVRLYVEISTRAQGCSADQENCCFDVRYL